jgi:integrase
MMKRISVSVFRPTVVRSTKAGKVSTRTEIWWAAWREPGDKKLHKVSTGTRNRQAAKKFAVRLEDKLYRQMIGDYSPVEEHRNLLFSVARDRYLEAKLFELRPASIAVYRQTLLDFERTVQPMELQKIDHRMIQRFITARAKSVVAQTVNKDLRQLRTFLKWCCRQDYISKCPDFKGSVLHVDKAEPRQVSDDEIQSVMRALDDPALTLTKCTASWWRVFIRMALFTGMRRAELLGLKWSDVDFDAGTVRVNRFTSKGRKDRSYEDAVELISMLREWHDQQVRVPAPSEKVLPFLKNVRGLYSDWDRILLHAGIPTERRFVPHDCRSTCVSGMLAEGVALTSVRDWVGHSSVAVTEHYYAATRSDRRKIASQRKIV